MSAGAEWIGGAVGWSEPLYKLWYLIGAIWVAGWLGLGTAYLLGRTRFGVAFATSLFLAGLFTYLTQAKYHYAQSGNAPILFFLAAMILAGAVVALSLRRDARWPALAAAPSWAAAFSRQSWSPPSRCQRLVGWSIQRRTSRLASSFLATSGS